MLTKVAVEAALRIRRTISRGTGLIVGFWLLLPGIMTSLFHFTRRLQHVPEVIRNIVSARLPVAPLGAKTMKRSLELIEWLRLC